MSRPRVLRIFSRYMDFGGEEHVARQIQLTLEPFMDADWFEGSTATLLGKNLFERLQAPFKIIANAEAAKKIRELHFRRQFDAWEIHNFFPGLSASIYAEAIRLKVPIVQYLHNYRFSCVNGMFLNHGAPCYRCIRGNFIPAIRTSCWRSSRLASTVGSVALTRVRRLSLFERIPVWVALSEAQKKLYVEIGVPAERIHIIPHFAVDLIHTPSDPPPDGYFLFLGRLSAEKGLRFLLEAWRRVSDPSARLVIAGSGPEEENLKRMVSTEKIRGVEFRGFVKNEDKELLWRGAKALIVPSIWDEPFGLVVLEAWAHGRAALVSDRGALPEIVRDSAAIFSSTDPGSLAECIGRSLKDPDTLSRLAAAGKRRLQEEYDPAHWLERIRAVYSHLGLELAN